jgi:hypothetical protein
VWRVPGLAGAANKKPGRFEVKASKETLELRIGSLPCGEGGHFTGVPLTQNQPFRCKRASGTGFTPLTRNGPRQRGILAEALAEN